MEGIGSEVSHKIRAAIKAKLIELGAYVDDELPDYIMVMVANKRTRSQMDEDLQLFLTSNTKIFTSWLHTVLQKLQEVTVASFESKKDPEAKKLKRKKSDHEDGSKSQKSDDLIGKSKKHSKKHKGSKKGKKGKHKSKDKTKAKMGKKLEKDEKSGSREEGKTSQGDMEKRSKDKLKTKGIQLNEAVGKAILGDLKKSEKLKGDKDDFSTGSSSSSEESSDEDDKNAKENDNIAQTTKTGTDYQDEDVLNIKVDDEPGGRDIECGKKDKKDLSEDEFNIEPLKPTEKSNEEVQEVEDLTKESPCLEEVQTEKTISAPTEELLKEHDKLQSQKLEGEEKMEEKKKGAQSESEESLSPEEMRKQLLLSRAKKKLEESKLAERMKSNSPEVLILEEGGREKNSVPAPRSSTGKLQEFRPSRTSPIRSVVPSKNSSRTGSPYRRSRRFSHSSGSSDSRGSRSPRLSPSRKPSLSRPGKQTVGEGLPEDRRKVSKSKADRNCSPIRYDGKQAVGSSDKKKNIIGKSESAERERKERKSKEKELLSKRKVLSSRVVTISEPDAPEIPSVVKVKPREYLSKDKQANKALILKAVADAEKSIATVHARNETEPESKKLEALFTKNLRGKRYEKLAVTLSNIRKSPDSRDRTDRKVSVDSERSDRSRLKQGSSDLSEGVRNRSDVPSKKMSRSEDQFISSKTSVMEKNDKYIRCWLEGVEKAGKEDGMVNPNEMEDFSLSHLSDDDNDFFDEELTRKDEGMKRKRLKTDEPSGGGDKSSKGANVNEEEIENVRLIPNSVNRNTEPQIVVKLYDLNSKTMKDIIIKNRDGINGPSGMEKDGKEKSPARKSGHEKISDRFARLNKVNTKNEDMSMGNDKRKYQSSEKKEKTGTMESKNKQLIAQLSEKFGKVDREFENKKRRYPDEDRRYYEGRRGEKEDERNGKYKRTERRSGREESKYDSGRRMRSRDRCIYWPDCSKGSSCDYFHPTSPSNRKDRRNWNIRENDGRNKRKT